MSYRNDIQHVTVASGDTLPSSAFDVRGTIAAALRLPSSLAGTVYLQGSWNTTSANFARAREADATIASSDWAVDVVANQPRAVNVTPVMAPFAYIRPELGTAATDTRTLSLLTRT